MNTTSHRLSRAGIAVLVLLGLAQHTNAASGTWIANTTSNWSDSTRWANGIIADGAGATGNITSNITGPRTVTIDTTSRTLGIFNVGDSDGSSSFTIASSGGATLTFDNNGANAQFNAVVTSNNNRISAPILLKDSLDINNSGATTLGFITGSGFTSATAGNKTITNRGTGIGVTISTVIGDGSGTVSVTQNSTTSSLTLSGVNTYTGATAVSAGTLIVSAGNINSTSGVSVASGATFTNSSATGFNKALALAEGATLSGVGTFAPTAMTLTANLSDGFTPIALGSTLTRGGNLELTLAGITNGTYTIFSGSVLGTFATMTVGGISLANQGGGNFSGLVGGKDYTFTNSTSQLIVAVPEPATWVLLGIGGFFFMIRGRFRRITW